MTSVTSRVLIQAHHSYLLKRTLHVHGGMSEDVSSSTSSSPEPPEPMDLEDGSEAGAEGLEEAVREAVVGQLQEKEEEELDLGRMAKEFAEYLVVDSKQDVSKYSPRVVMQY